MKSIMRDLSGASSAAVAAVLVTVAMMAGVWFFMTYYQPVQGPEPEVISTTNGWGNYGFTYVLYVTVGNKGVSGNFTVFAEVKAVQGGTTRFLHTEERSFYLDSGATETITVEFNSEWFTTSDVTNRVWTTVP